MNVDERVKRLSHSVRHVLVRSGAVVQVSGGIDSAVTLYLSVRAFGPERVAALFMPDSASAMVSYEMALQAATSAECQLRVIDINDLMTLLVPPGEVADIIRGYFDDYDEQKHGYAINIDSAASIRLGTPVFRLHVGIRHSSGALSALLKPSDLRRLMAAQNIKQRIRMMLAYRYAEEHGYAVVGASNADEIELGFTVKFGDEAADVYAIADLGKSEVRQLAKELGVPADIQSRTPTTDTFTLQQSQAEYYFIADPEAMRSLDSDNAGVYTTEAMRDVINVFRRNAEYNRLHIRLDKEIM